MKTRICLIVAIVAFRATAIDSIYNDIVAYAMIIILEYRSSETIIS